MKNSDKGSEELRSIVKENVDTLVMAWEFAGFTSEGWNRKGTMDWHESCVRALGGDWMRFYKYKCAAFFAAALDLVPPPSPLTGTECADDLPDVVLGGKAGRWAQTLKKKDKDRWLELAVSVLYAKKGMRRPSKEMVEQAVQKAYEKLTSPGVVKKDTVKWSDMNDDDDEQEPSVMKFTFKSKLRTVVRQLFEKTPYTLDYQSAMAMPSTSAVYTKTVAKGGMIGELLSNPEVLALREVLPNVLIGVEMTEEGLQKVDDTELRLAYQRLSELCWRLADAEPGSAKFVGLPEALKVRVITTGPPYRNFVLKQLQRFMWRQVRRCPAATLVGETISEEYLCAQLGQLRDGEEYTSVDYSDATNEIEGWVSEVIVNEIADCCGLSALQRRIALNNLTGHRFENPSKKGEWKTQVRGQLMGSILSFPVLCVANIAICALSQEQDRKRPLNIMLSGSKGPAFCINGDDAVLRGTDSHKYWLQWCSTAGLSPSPGKVYQNKTFLNMNSTHYNVCEPYQKPGIAPQATVTTTVAPNGAVTMNVRVQGAVDETTLFLKRTLYVNLGLLKGYKRSEVKVAVADVGLPDSIGAVARFLVDYSPARCREQVLKKYLNAHWAKLQKTSLPWFLPEHLGGLGIPRPASELGQKGLAQDMRLAAAMYKQPLPVRPTNKEWMMMDIAQRAMRKQGIKPHIVLGGDPAGGYGLRSLFVISALLQAPKIGRLYKPADETDEAEAEKVWSDYQRKVEHAVKRARKRMGKVEPFQPDKLPKKPLYEEVFLMSEAITHTAEPRERSAYTLTNLGPDDD